MRFSRIINETRNFFACFSTFNTSEARLAKVFPFFELNPVNRKTFSHLTFVVYGNIFMNDKLVSVIIMVLLDCIV